MKKRLTVFIMVISAPFQCACADTIWNWSFGGESGQFVTDTGAGGNAGTYNLLDFSVTASSVGGTLGSLSGGDYTDDQFGTNLPYSFTYGGSAVTQWNHSGFNGSDWWVFDSISSDISYIFAYNFDAPSQGLLNDPRQASWWIGPDAGQHGAATVTVSPAVSPPWVPVPIPAALWLFSSGLIGLIGITRRSKGTSRNFA